MFTRRIVWISLGLACVIILAGLTGCASTSPSMSDETQTGEVADIDQLLGLSDEEALDAEADDEAIAEDDILRLLGVMEENEADTPTPTRRAETEPAATDVNTADTRSTTPLETTENRVNETTEQRRDTTVPPVTDRVSSTPSRTVNTTTTRSGSFEGRYQTALRDYRGRRYREAIQQFELLLDENSKHSLSDNSQYWIGESYYGLGNYQQAIVAFQRVFGFANSNKDDAAQLKLGLCYMRLGDNERAKLELQKLTDNYTSSEYVSLARRLLGQIQ